MRKQDLVRLILPYILATALHAQMLLNDLPDKDLGRPPLPPLISFLAIGYQGKMATDPTATPAGPASTVTFEELRVNAQGTIVPGEISSSSVTHYDELGRPTEQTYTQSGFSTTTVTKYQGSHMISSESSWATQGKPVKAWTYWKYDQSGKLTDFSRGRNDALENHYTNFARDDKGRLLSFEYRQGTKDDLLNQTKFVYSSDGMTITRTESDSSGAFLNSVTEVLNAKGQVIQATIVDPDLQTKRPGAPITATFSYDEQGRLIEQLTDAGEPEDEQSLPPGKVSLSYDDASRLRRTSYESKDGSLSSTVFLDSSGQTVGHSLEATATSTSIALKLECTYDDHGNWTRCLRLVETGGTSKMTGAWRRSITYRQPGRP